MRKRMSFTALKAVTRSLTEGMHFEMEINTVKFFNKKHSALCPLENTLACIFYNIFSFTVFSIYF